LTETQLYTVHEWPARIDIILVLMVGQSRLSNSIRPLLADQMPSLRVCRRSPDRVCKEASVEDAIMTPSDGGDGGGVEETIEMNEGSKIQHMECINAKITSRLVLSSIYMRVNARPGLNPCPVYTSSNAPRQLCCSLDSVHLAILG
jgi:hypothetical protein